MAKLRVHEWLSEDHAEAGMDWEQEAYRAGCAYARELGERRLQTLDDELMRNRPKGLRLVGSRVRTVVTRFGDVTVGRRLYRDTDGETVFLLDEYLGWKPQQQASPSITESIVGMAAQMPFRVVTEVVSALTAGVLSKSSVHRMVQGVGQDALDEDRERWEAQFERGEEMSEGRQRSDILYTEADGVWIHLQREARKHYEVKSGIAYRGWRRVAQERYELVGKRVYVHGDDTIPFWEGASLEWSKQYALDKVKQFVVGGDGAAWIGRGTEEFGNAVFQLDGFHLSRACGRGYGADIGPAIFEAIRSGSHDYARALISAAPPAETATAIRDAEYVESNLVNGVDWRNRAHIVPADARSLGTMESNGDKLTANRMKKRGMSWTIRGANRMAKTVQLSRNGELSRFCHSRSVQQPRLARLRPPPRDRSASTTRISHWAEASVPALSGPHNSRPWVTELRRFLHTAY